MGTTVRSQISRTDPASSISLFATTIFKKLQTNGRPCPSLLDFRYEPYTQGTDDDYYLGLGKKYVLDNGTDVLGNTILDCGKKTLCEPTWQK